MKKLNVVCCLVSVASKWPQINKTWFTEIHEKESRLSVNVSMLSHPGNHRKFVRFTKINFSDFQWTRFSRLTWVLNRCPVTEAHRRLASPAGTEPDWRFRRQKFTTTSLTLFEIQKSSSWRINLNVWQGWILSSHHRCQHKSSRLIRIQTWALGIIIFFLGVVPAEQSMCSCCHINDVLVLKLNASLSSLQCFLTMCKMKNMKLNHSSTTASCETKEDLKGVQMTGLHNWHRSLYRLRVMLLCSCVVPGTGWSVAADSLSFLIEIETMTVGSTCCVPGINHTWGCRAHSPKACWDTEREAEDRLRNVITFLLFFN